MSDQLVEAMCAWDVSWVFGMVGHSNLGFADALRMAEARGDVQFIGVRHEGAAAFAATAYGKLTGGLAACFAIAGAGSTNLLTGLYDAKMDRAPVLALSGQVPSSVRGRGAFQDTDLSAAFADVSRYSATVQAGSNAAELMNLACKAALTERDVAHLVLPDEVQVLPAATDASAAGSPEGRTGSRQIAPPADALEGAVELLAGATRPMITVGHGARSGIDPMALGRFHSVTAPMLADVGTGARALADALRVRAAPGGATAEVAERWDIWRAEKQRRRADDRGSGLNSAVVFEVLSHLVPADAIMPVDVCNHAYSFGRYFEPCGQTVLMSGYLGSIGFALPAAMGCWAATQRAPDVDGGRCAGRPVVSVTGDGGFGQYAMELTTAVKYGMDITHVLLNNGELGKIAKEQRAAELDVWQTSLHNPSLAGFAELCGAMGRQVTAASELDAALIDALEHPGPALVEVMTDPLLG